MHTDTHTQRERALVSFAKLGLTCTRTYTHTQTHRALVTVAKLGLIMHRDSGGRVVVKQVLCVVLGVREEDEDGSTHAQHRGDDHQQHRHLALPLAGGVREMYEGERVFMCVDRWVGGWVGGWGVDTTQRTVY